MTSYIIIGNEMWFYCLNTFKIPCRAADKPIIRRHIALAIASNHKSHSNDKCPALGN